MARRLENKVAWVTGSSRGIGRVVASHLASLGADVAVHGTTPTSTRQLNEADSLDAVAQEIAEKHDANVLAVHGDLTDVDTVARLVAEIHERFGRIDILINNAGFGYFAPLVEMDAGRFEALFATNVTGAMLMGREAARHFVRQGSGQLVNISSTSGLKGGQNGSAYSASKFALRGMTECWREELRRHDVRVLLVNPSEVVTDFASSAGYEQQDAPRKLHAEQIAQALVGALEIDDVGFIPELSVFATNPF